jgi:hypothetical protein
MNTRNKDGKYNYRLHRRTNYNCSFKKEVKFCKDENNTKQIHSMEVTIKYSFYHLSDVVIKGIIPHTKNCIKDATWTMTPIQYNQQDAYDPSSRGKPNFPGLPMTRLKGVEITTEAEMTASQEKQDMILYKQHKEASRVARENKRIKDEQQLAKRLAEQAKKDKKYKQECWKKLAKKEENANKN